MRRYQISNTADISVLTWIKPSLFINHAKIDGDYTTIVASNEIILDRSGYTDDENLFVYYLEVAIAEVERLLPNDLIAKTYTEYFDAKEKILLRGRVDAIISIEFNESEITDYKIVDDILYVENINEYTIENGGDYIKVVYSVLNNETPESIIKQSVMMLFTYLFDNRGDCIGDACGCDSVMQLLSKHLPPMV